MIAYVYDLSHSSPRFFILPALLECWSPSPALCDKLEELGCAFMSRTNDVGWPPADELAESGRDGVTIAPLGTDPNLCLGWVLLSEGPPLSEEVDILPPTFPEELEGPPPVPRFPDMVHPVTLYVMTLCLCLWLLKRCCCWYHYYAKATTKAHWFCITCQSLHHCMSDHLKLSRDYSFRHVMSHWCYSIPTRNT